MYYVESGEFKFIIIYFIRVNNAGFRTLVAPTPWKKNVVNIFIIFFPFLTKFAGLSLNRGIQPRV